jgi:hypothetical protein
MNASSVGGGSAATDLKAGAPLGFSIATITIPRSKSSSPSWISSEYSASVPLESL